MSVFRFCSPKRKKKTNRVTPYVFGSGTDRLHFFLQKELERVSLLQSQEAETQQEEEEDAVWRQWEEHRQQIAAEQTLLADKENQLQKELQDALAELEAVRRQLSSEQGKFRALMDEQVRRFLRANSQDLEWTPKPESQELGIQAMYDFAELVGEEKRLNGEMSDKDKLLGIADLYGAEILSLRNSFEGQKRQLMHVELVQQLKTKDSIQEVSERRNKIEEMFLANSEKIEGEKKALEDKERHYQQQDSDKLQAINSQREKIKKLEQRQRQLIMYIEEKEREKYLPDSERVEPIGESCSEESLAGHKATRYSQPTKSSLLKKHARSTSEPTTTFPNKRRYLSPVQVHNIQQSDDKSGLPRSANPAAPQGASPKQKEKSLAKQVTERLYKSQENSDSPKQKKKAQESFDGHTRSKSAPALKSDKRMVPVGMVPSAPRLRHSSSSLASVPESCDEGYQRTDHDTSITDTAVDISYDESSRMYDSESLRFSECDSRARARSASPSISLALMSGRSSAVDQTQRSNVTSRGEGSGEEVRDDTRTTPEGLGEKLTEDHPDAHIPYTEADLIKSDTFHHDDEAFDPSLHFYHRKEQSPSPMRTRQVSESPAGRGSSRGRGRAKERYIPGKTDKTQPRPGQTSSKTTSSVMKETQSSKAKRSPSKEDAQSPQLSRNSSKENGRSPQLGRSSSRESVSSTKSARSVSRSSVSSVKSDRSVSVASNKSEKNTSKDGQLVHMDSASSVDSSSLSQASSSQSGPKNKSKDSSSSDSKKSKGKKSKSEKSALGEKVLSKPKKKKTGDPPVEIFIAGSSGGAGGTSLDMGENEQRISRPHTDAAHELFARSLRGGSIEKEYRPFTEEVFSSSDGAKYIVRRRQSDDRSNSAESTRDRSQGSSKPNNLAVERMISGESNHSIPESMDSLENPTVLSMSLPNWKLARSDNGVYSDDSLDERMSPEGRKQSPRDVHSPAATTNSRSHFSYDSLDDENRAPSIGHSGNRATAPLTTTRLEPVVDCEVLTSGEYQPSHISVDSLMEPAEGLGQAPEQPDNGEKETPKATKSTKKREGSFRSSRKSRQQHLSPAAEAEAVTNLSDDSLASSGELKPSESRPSSASKRRRKLRPSSASKKSKQHSSEEYATSDNDSVYSEDSLGNSDDKKDQLLIKTLPQTAHHMASITENVEALTTALQDEYLPDHKGHAEEGHDRLQKNPDVADMDVDLNSERSPRLEYQEQNAPKYRNRVSQNPAEQKWLTEDIVIELDSDPAETLDGSSEFGSVRISYGRELTPGRMSPPTQDSQSASRTASATLMDTEIEVSSRPQERHMSSSSSSHSPASSTDSSPRHQEYLASSDQYSPYNDDTDIRLSLSLSGPKIDSALPLIDSKVPEIERDYNPKLNTIEDSEDKSLTDKLEMTQLDPMHADYSSAIEKFSDSVQDKFSSPEDLHVVGVNRDNKHEWEQTVDTKMPRGHKSDHKNDPRMDRSDHDGMMSPHVVSDDAHVTSVNDHAMTGERHDTRSYDNVKGKLGSSTHADKMDNDLDNDVSSGSFDVTKHRVPMSLIFTNSTMEVDQNEQDLGTKKAQRAQETIKHQQKTRSPGGQDHTNAEGRHEEVPVTEGLSPRSDSLHESSESTVSNDTVIEALQDTSSSSSEGETDMTEIDDELKSTPTHASYSAGALTEEEVMPLSTRWSSSDSAIDVVEDHPMTSHTSESETQRDSGAHSADDMLDDEYRPVKTPTQIKGQYNQDSVVNESSLQDASIKTHTDILDNHKHDSIDPHLHELTHKVTDKDLLIGGSKLSGDLHHPREVLVYSATRQDGSVVPEISLPFEKPEVTSTKEEVTDPRYEIKVVIEEEANDVINVVNLMPVNKDKPQANNRDSGYYSMPSESGLMSSSSITEGDNSVNDVFTPQPTMGSPYPVFEGQDFLFTSTPQGKVNFELNQNEETLFVMEDLNGQTESESIDETISESNNHMDLSVIDHSKDHQDKRSGHLGLSTQEGDINHSKLDSIESDSCAGLNGSVNHISGTLEKQPSLEDRATSQDMHTPDPSKQTNIDHSVPEMLETNGVPGSEPSATCPKQLRGLNATPQSTDTNTDSQECRPHAEDHSKQATSGASSKLTKNDREDTMDSSNSDSWSLEDTVKENNTTVQKGWSFEDESLRLDLGDVAAGNTGLSEFSTPRSDSTDAETTREVRSAIGQAVGQYALLHSVSVDSAASDDTLAAAFDFDFYLDETLMTIEDADEDEENEDGDEDENAVDDSIEVTQDANDTSLQLPAVKSKPVLSPAASVSEDESLHEASDSDGEILPLQNNLLARLQGNKNGDSDADSKKYDYSDSFESDSTDNDDDDDVAKKVYEAAASANDQVGQVSSASATPITGDLNASYTVKETNDSNQQQVENNQSALGVPDLSMKNDNVARSDDCNVTSTDDSTVATDDQYNKCEGTQEVFTATPNTADGHEESGVASSRSDPSSPSSKLQETSLDEGYVTINNTSDLLDVSADTMNDISHSHGSHTVEVNSINTEDIESRDGNITDDEASIDELQNQSTAVGPIVNTDHPKRQQIMLETPLEDHQEQHSTPPMTPASSEEDIRQAVEVALEADTTDEVHFSDLITQPLHDYDMPEPARPFSSDMSDAGEFTVVHFKAPEPEKKSSKDAISEKMERAKELVQSQLLMLEAADVLHQQSQLLDETYPTLPDEEDAPELQVATGLSTCQTEETKPDAMDYEDDFESGPTSESGSASGSGEGSASGASSSRADRHNDIKETDNTSYLAPPKNVSNTKGSSSSKESSIPEEIDAASMSKSASECVYEDDFEELTKSSTARSVEESLISNIDSSQQLSEDYSSYSKAMDDTTNLILKEIERTKQISRISSGSSLAVEVGDPDTAKLDDDLEAYEVTDAIHSPLKDDSFQTENNSSLLSSPDSKDVEDMIDPWMKVKVDNKRGQMHHQPSSLSMVAEMGDDQPEDVSVDVERMSDEEEGSQKVGFVISESDLDEEAEDEVNISDYEGLEETEVADGDDSERWTHISRKSEHSKKSSASMVVHIGEQEDEAAVSGSEEESQGGDNLNNAANNLDHEIPPPNGHLFEDHADDHTSTTSGFASYDDFSRKTGSSFAGDTDGSHQSAINGPPGMPVSIPRDSALTSRTSSMESAWSTTPTVGEMLEHIDEVNSLSTEADAANADESEVAPDTDVDQLIDSVTKERNELRHGLVDKNLEDSPSHAPKENERVDVAVAEEEEVNTPIVVTMPHIEKPEKLDTVLKKYLDKHEFAKPTNDSARPSSESPMQSGETGNSEQEIIAKEVNLEDTTEQEFDEEDNTKRRSTEDQPLKPANFIDSKVTGFDVNPWESVVRESPPLENDTTQQVVIGSQETLDVNSDKKESHSRGFQVLGLQPERVREIADDKFVYAEEPSVPCLDHLKHSAINIEIRPWRMAEGEEYRPKSESLSSAASEEVADISSDDSRAFVSAQDAQDILDNLKRAMLTRNTESEVKDQEDSTVDLEILVGPEAENPTSFTSDAVLSNTGSTNADADFDMTDFGNKNSSDAYPMIHLPDQLQGETGTTLRVSDESEIAVNPLSSQSNVNIRELYDDGQTSYQENETKFTSHAGDSLQAFENIQRPVSPSMDDLMKDLIAAQNEWLSIHGEDDGQFERESELAVNDRNFSDVDSEAGYDANDMADIFAEVSELPDVLVTSEFSSLRDTWLNRRQYFQRSLSMSELELIEPRDRYEGISLSADCLITMDMQATKTMSTDSITYVFMSRPISCGDMVDLESWSPPHRRRSVPGFRRGTSMVDRTNKRVIEEDRSVSAECLSNKYTETSSKYLSYSADASRFIQPQDPFLGREGDIFGPQDDDTDYEGEPTNFFAVSYDTNPGEQESRSELPTPNSMFDDASVSMGSDSVFDSNSHLASGHGMENLSTVGISSENLSSDVYGSEQSIYGAEKDKTKKAVSWGHISEKCIEDRPFVSVTPKLKIVPGSPDESELNLLADASEVKPGRRRSRSLSPSHADQINNQLNKSNLAPTESTSQTGDSLEKVNREIEDEALRQTHHETTQLLQEALQTIHKGMGTQTDSMSTVSINLQTDSPPSDARNVSLGFRSDLSESRSSVGGSTGALGPTDSGVFDGQATAASITHRRHSDVQSRSSQERPLVLGNSRASGSQQMVEDYSSTLDSMRNSSRSLPDEYYRFMGPSLTSGLSQRTIETQTYPQVRYIETQTALQMRYIETQTEDEDFEPSFTSQTIKDYISVQENKREEPLKIVVDTGVSPSPPLSPKEFGSQTDESFFSQTTETAIQTDPDAAVIRASSPELFGMVAVGMQAGTPHLSAAEMSASSEDEDSRVIHSRSRSRSRQRESPDTPDLVGSSDDEDLAKISSKKVEKSRTRKVPVFSEIRGVLGSNAVPTGVSTSPNVSPRSLTSSAYSTTLVNEGHLLTLTQNNSMTSLEQTTPETSSVIRNEINAINEEEEIDSSSMQLPDEDAANVLISPRTTFRASQNLIEKVRCQVSKLDQMDEYETTGSITDVTDFTTARSSDQPSTATSDSIIKITDGPSSTSPEPTSRSEDNSISADSFPTSEADSTGSATTPSSASSKMTVITDVVDDHLSISDQSDTQPRSQNLSLERSTDGQDHADVIILETLDDQDHADVITLETLDDQAVYISKLGDVVIDSSVPISEEDADKLRAAVQAGDEDLLAKTIEEINQSLSKPNQDDTSAGASPRSGNEASHHQWSTTNANNASFTRSHGVPQKTTKKETKSGSYRITTPAIETATFKHDVMSRNRRSPHTSSPSIGTEPQELDRLGLSPVPSVEESRGQFRHPQTNGSVTVETISETVVLEPIEVDQNLELPRSGAALSTVTQQKTPFVLGKDVISQNPTTVIQAADTRLSVPKPRSRSASTQWDDTDDIQNTSGKSGHGLTNGAMSPPTKDGRSPNTSMKDEASETDFTDKMYDDELEQLRRERQRILDMLAKDMMPSKFQVELAEAQLNYIIGQTDTLLSTLDEPSVWDSEWLMQLGAPEAKLSEIGQEHLDRYRQTLEASRLQIERRIEHLERDRERAGRSRERSRAMDMMKRDAQLQAFKLEREREQITYERTKMRSPRSRSDSPDTRRGLGSHSPIPPVRRSPGTTPHTSFTSQGPVHSTPLPSYGPQSGPYAGSPPDPPSYSSVMSQRSSQGSSSHLSRSSRRDSQGSPTGSMFSSASSFTLPDSLPTSHMTPKQRKEHLIGLRKNLLSSSGEFRSRSESPATTAANKSKPLPRSYSPMFTYSTFSSPPSSVTSPKKTKRPMTASTNYSLLSTAYPATDELHRETEERLTAKLYHGRQRDGYMSDTASISSLISSLDDDSIQLLNEYQEVRGQADKEIIKAKETLQKKPSTNSSGKKPINYLQRRLELESLKQQVEQNHQQHPTKDREELEKSRQRPLAGPPAKEEIDSEIERLKLKYGSIGSNSSDTSSRSSLPDKSPDGSSSVYPPGGRTSTPQQDIQDTLRRYQTGSDISATKGSALDASTWGDTYLDSRLNSRSETNRTSHLPPTRDFGSSYGRYTSPHSSSSSFTSSYSYRSYASPYTGSSRSNLSTRRPLHLTETPRRGYTSKR